MRSTKNQSNRFLFNPLLLTSEKIPRLKVLFKVFLKL